MILLANPHQNLPEDMVLRFEGEGPRPEGYYVKIPRETWEGLLEVNRGEPPDVSVGEAYKREKRFWDWLALNCADSLSRNEKSEPVADDVDQLKTLYEEWGLELVEVPIKYTTTE